MVPMNITIASALIAGGFGLFGTLIGGTITWLLQKRALNAQAISNEHYSKLRLLLNLLERYENTQDALDDSLYPGDTADITVRIIRIINSISVTINTMELSEDYRKMIDADIRGMYSLYESLCTDEKERYKKSMNISDFEKAYHTITGEDCTIGCKNE